MTDDPRQRAERLLARSPFAMPRKAALDCIEQRRRELLALPPPPAPDFTRPEPSPLPIVDQPQAFASDFWAKRSTPLGHPPPPPKPKPRPKKPAGRRPLGDLRPEHDKFRVVPGGKDDGDKKA